jgi:hypothetical protein
MSDVCVVGELNLDLILYGLPKDLALDRELLASGLALTLGGLLYKLAVFPFHFWTPDVYQGASNETTSLVASLPMGSIRATVSPTGPAQPAAPLEPWFGGKTTFSEANKSLAAVGADVPEMMN